MCIRDRHNGLTGPQGLVLGYLYDHQDKDIFQKDIEATFNIRRSTATGLLQCLEGNGFVKRVSVDYDARLKKLSLIHILKIQNKKIHIRQLILKPY